MRLHLILSTILITALCLVGTTSSAETPDPRGSFGERVTMLEEPVPIPDFAFEERLDDGVRRDWGMVEFRDQVVVLNFWASWCGVCAKELPKLDALAPKLDDGVSILPLSIDESISEAAGALSKRGHANLRVLHDTETILSTLLGVEGIPTTFIVDPAGNAIARINGPADWNSAEARAFLESLRPAKAARGPAPTRVASERVTSER